MAKKFTIVDVFAERRYSGNQLAVVEADGTESTADLQAIAREFGFSETVFLLPGSPISEGEVADRASDSTGVSVRIFTPANELPFAGHPTIGAAWVIRHGMTSADAADANHALPAEIILQEGVGPIRTWFEGEGPDATVWMQQNQPEFGATYDAAAAAASLSLQAGDVDDSLFVEHVSTGIPFLIVPLASLDALKRARADLHALKDLFGDDATVPLLLFTRGAEEPGHDIRARMFAAEYGIAEDPATGSANGCLAGYFVRHGVFPDTPLRVAVEQGYEMGRPSVLYLEAEQDRSDADAGITVRVGGRVQLVATGELA